MSRDVQLCAFTSMSRALSRIAFSWATSNVCNSTHFQLYGVVLGRHSNIKISFIQLVANSLQALIFLTSLFIPNDVQEVPCTIAWKINI